MKIVICTFAFTLADELKRMVASAQSAKHDVRFYIGMHSQKPSVTAACYEIAAQRNAKLYEWGHNRGLARSLNDLMLDAYCEWADVVINCNDDAIWGVGDVDRLAENALDCPKYYAVSAAGQHSNRGEKASMGYCVIAINPLAISALGCFDENFFPAYYEDTDYELRAERAGLKYGICEQTNCYHEGSLSIRSDDEIMSDHHTSFLLNEAYFKRKWGPSRDYATPFNAPELGNRIALRDRRSPYGKRDRVDLPYEALALPEVVR